MESRAAKLAIHHVLPEALDENKTAAHFMAYCKSIQTAFTRYK